MRRDQVRTPARIIGLDVLDGGVTMMAASATAQGVSLRLHAKAHKSAEIARRLAAAGGAGSDGQSDLRHHRQPLSARDGGQ